MKNKKTNLKTMKSTIDKIKQELGEHVRLIAVSKTHPPEVIMQAYEAGCRDFGENKVQEMLPKYEALPKDIRWHLIGHLQRNKVKYIAPFVHLIHSVDSEALLREINKRAAQNERVIDCLLQIHIAQEESKYGLSYEEAHALLTSSIWEELPHVRIIGLMGMATFTDDTAQIRREFRGLKHFFDEHKQYERPNVKMQELSMGMSGDYRIAIEEGSTMVRIGSAIFGQRQYT
ncbi:YggS family pyridoxal phosphate-dependent enzyme [Thermonema sp.]|uniref:YggS family pyridoxal phosphate-dependent enzyme n=1 Tax=Thermonema sp. TaxID=2231181 RepID=UPI0025851FE8|nr:YggS family pyridoxal phosphate-dependent enzyme [Thermonema sp.]